MAKLAIKSDNRKQNLLLPPSLDELVPENHMVRVVDAVIDRLDISDILSTYRGGGNSAFNPKMMLKVLVFAYLSNVYSSRRIEDLLKRDIYFMWLAGMKRPDFRTINYYRGKRLKEGTPKSRWSQNLRVVIHCIISIIQVYQAQSIKLGQHISDKKVSV